jgi:hypothetical protein
VRIHRGDDDVGDAAGDQGEGAGGGAPVEGAGLEGNEGGEAVSVDVGAEVGERGGFGVRVPRRAGITACDDCLTTDDDAADGRIGAACGQGRSARGERLCHPVIL